MSWQFFIHYFLHLVAPLLIALIFFRSEWKKVYLILLGTMLVDLDHLLATPVFKADRCGIGFHFLHSGSAIVVYVGMLFLKQPYRLVAVGLLFHMLTDTIDCFFMFEKCNVCHEGTPLYDLWQALVS